MRLTAAILLLCVLVGCTGRDPANSTNTTVPAPAPAENRPANEVVESPAPAKAPPAVQATRSLGSQKLAGSTLTAELELPWSAGDAPAFRVRLDPDAKLAMQGWVEDERREKLGTPARLLFFEGIYRVHPVLRECPPGDYFLVISTETAMGTEMARFPVQLR